MTIYCGRDFSPADIQTIRALIEHNPKLLRSPLSRRLCELFAWFKPNGELKDMAQLVHRLDHVAQVVAALDLVLDLAEDFTNLVFDGVGPAGALLEARQVGEELGVDEVAQVVAGHRRVVVERAACGFWGGPGLPPVGLFNDEAVGLAFQCGFVGLIGFKRVEVLQKKQPGRLLGVVQLAGAACVLVQDVVDVLESLLKHSFPFLLGVFRFL